MMDPVQRSRRLTRAMKALASEAERRKSDPPEVMLGLTPETRAAGGPRSG